MRSLNIVFNRSKCRGRARFVCCCVILRRCMALLVGCGVALLPARPVDLRAWGEGVVEYPGKVACPSGRRCSTRNAVWCHSHPGFKSQRYRHCRPAPLGPGGFVIPGWCGRVRVRVCACCGMLLVAPRVFRAPSGPAAREARRPHFVRRRASKPARALRTLRCPPHRRHLVADRWLGALSPRCSAGPCRRPRAPQPGPGLLSVAQSWLSIINFACNSPESISGIEI